MTYPICRLDARTAIGKLLAADTEAARFVVRILFDAGTLLPPHTATTGTVHAFTNAGKWTYLERYDDGQSCTAGSYLSEDPQVLFIL